MKLSTHATTSLSLGLCAAGFYLAKTVELDLHAGEVWRGLNSVVIASGIFAGGLYPNIDSKESLMRPNGYEVLEWEDNFGHRGVIHTLVNAIGINLPFLILRVLLSFLTKGKILDSISLLGLSMSIGCIWHMVMDTFSGDGIMWLYPLVKKKIKLPICNSEKVQLIFGVLVCAGFIGLASFGVPWEKIL